MEIFTINVVFQLSPALSVQLDRLIEALGPAPDVTALEAKLTELEGKTGDLQAAVDRNKPPA